MASIMAYAALLEGSWEEENRQFRMEAAQFQIGRAATISTVVDAYQWTWEDCGDLLGVVELTKLNDWRAPLQPVLDLEVSLDTILGDSQDGKYCFVFESMKEFVQTTSDRAEELSTGAVSPSTLSSGAGGEPGDDSFGSALEVDAPLVAAPEDTTNPNKATTMRPKQPNLANDAGNPSKRPASTSGDSDRVTKQIRRSSSPKESNPSQTTQGSSKTNAPAAVKVAPESAEQSSSRGRVLSQDARETVFDLQPGAQMPQPPKAPYRVMYAPRFGYYSYAPGVPMNQPSSGSFGVSGGSGNVVAATKRRPSGGTARQSQSTLNPTLASNPPGTAQEIGGGEEGARAEAIRSEQSRSGAESPSSDPMDVLPPDFLAFLSSVKLRTTEEFLTLVGSRLAKSYHDWMIAEHGKARWKVPNLENKICKWKEKVRARKKEVEGRSRNLGRHHSGPAQPVYHSGAVHGSDHSLPAQPVYHSGVFQGHGPCLSGVPSHQPWFVSSGNLAIGDQSPTISEMSDPMDILPKDLLQFLSSIGARTTEKFLTSVASRLAQSYHDWTIAEYGKPSWKLPTLENKIISWKEKVRDRQRWIRVSDAVSGPSKTNAPTAANLPPKSTGRMPQPPLAQPVYQPGLPYGAMYTPGIGPCPYVPGVASGIPSSLSSFGSFGVSAAVVQRQTGAELSSDDPMDVFPPDFLSFLSSIGKRNATKFLSSKPQYLARTYYAWMKVEHGFAKWDTSTIATKIGPWKEMVRQRGVQIQTRFIRQVQHAQAQVQPLLVAAIPESIPAPATRPSRPLLSRRDNVPQTLQSFTPVQTLNQKAGGKQNPSTNESRTEFPSQDDPMDALPDDFLRFLSSVNMRTVEQFLPCSNRKLGEMYHDWLEATYGVAKWSPSTIGMRLGPWKELVFKGQRRHCRRLKAKNKGADDGNSESVSAPTGETEKDPQLQHGPVDGERNDGEQEPRQQRQGRVAAYGHLEEKDESSDEEGEGRNFLAHV